MSEKPQLISAEPEGPASALQQRQSQYQDDTISNEPKANPGMSLHPDHAHNDDSASENASSYADVASGYDKDSNECTDFCIELSTCFGLLDTCCPDDGEGCLTTSAVFCGNILVGCCSKCK